MELTVLLGSFTLLLLIGTPVAFALGGATLACVFYMDLPPVVVFQQLSSGMNVFSMLAIPFFVFAGDLMLRGQIADRLVALAAAMVGHLRGGLGQVNVIAAGGAISVADLFTAGIIPGIVMMLTLMVVAWLVAIQRGYPREAFPGWGALLRLVVGAIPGLMLIVIIFAGVRSGIFTATESACVAVIYALLVTVLVYRSLGWTGFTEAVGGAVRTTGMVMLIIGTATAFGWLMALLQVPAQTVAFMRGITEDPIMTLLLINVILLVLGTFMDMAPLIMIGTPIFLPVVKALGMDPVQFGIVLIVNLGIG